MGAEGNANGWTATRYYRIPEFYGAISYAETGGEKDPWIRTKSRPSFNTETKKWEGSSTAYGPAQVTATTANDFVKRYPSYFKHMKNYTDRFAQQGELFRKHGMNSGKPGYDPRFDYGGSGTLGTGIDRKYYQAMTQRIMALQEREVLGHMGKNPAYHALLRRRIQAWRGVPESEDPAYYARVYEYLSRLGDNR